MPDAPPTQFPSPALMAAIRLARGSGEPITLADAIDNVPLSERTRPAVALLQLALRGHWGELAPTTPRPTERGALRFVEIGAAMSGGVAVLDHLPDMGDGRAHARLTLLDVHHGDGPVAIDLVLPGGGAPLQAYALDMGGWVFVPTDTDMSGRLTRAAILAMS